MKKYIHKVFAFLLVCTLFSSLLLPVSAAEVDNCVASSYMSSDNKYEIFERIQATNVRERLNSDVSNKKFATYDHEGREIQFDGCLTHTTSTSNDIRVGLCHPVAPNGTFRDEVYKDYKSGETLTLTTEASSLPTDNHYPNAQTYYVFVENKASSGTISGTIYLYSAPLKY